MPGIFYSSDVDDTQDLFVVDETELGANIGLKCYMFEIHKRIELYNLEKIKVYETDEVIYTSNYYTMLNRMAFFVTYILNTIFEDENKVLNSFLSVSITYSSVLKYVKTPLEFQYFDDDFMFCVDLNIINSTYVNIMQQTLHAIYICV